jgi:predicted RNA polymerase sigma factor
LGAIESAPADVEAAIDDDIGDDLLRLVFIACHPVLTTEARVASRCASSAGSPRPRSRAPSSFRAHGGAAHRARQGTLAEARVPFEVPRGAERQERLTPCSRSST